MKIQKTATALILLGLASVALFVASLYVGEVDISPIQVLNALFFGQGDDTHVAVVRELRFPRVLCALVVGGLLALAGGLLQVLLRNPLADPYILGIASGASVAALSAILLGFSAGAVSLASFGGAFAVMVVVFALAHSAGAWTHNRLLLIGVIISYGTGAFISLLLTLSQDQAHSMMYWMMGDLNSAESSAGWYGLLVLVAGLGFAVAFAKDLNAVSRGELLAQSLGVDIRKLRYGIYLVASLLTAAAVTIAGTIGFVGFVVPHLVRLLLGNDQRMMLPTSALAGGALLMAADLVSRVALRPIELPVGLVTVMLGFPLFLYLLLKKNA